MRRRETDPFDIVAAESSAPGIEGMLERFVGTMVVRSAGSVMTMPMLERPVFDQECLPEKAGALKAILYTWMYCYRKFEYAVDPLRRGFLAWVRLFLSIQVFIVLPVAVSMGLILGFAYCVIILTKTTCEVAEATLDLVMALLLLALGLLGLVVVVYLIYLVLAMVFQWKVRLPFRRPEGAAPRTITRRVHEVDKEGKC